MPTKQSASKKRPAQKRTPPASSAKKKATGRNGAKSTSRGGRGTQSPPLTAEAIRQIKERQYALRLEGKFGEKPEYTGRILAVGIAYYKDDPEKRHECLVEVLREKLR